MRSMRSSAFNRLCAWRALVALARKREMKLSKWAMVRCCFWYRACCTASCAARLSSNTE